MVQQSFIIKFKIKIQYCIFLNIVLLYEAGDNRVTGWDGLYSIWNGGDAMKNQNHFDFKDLLNFGIFLLALLTFVFTFCK